MGGREKKRALAVLIERAIEVKAERCQGLDAQRVTSGSGRCGGIAPLLLVAPPSAPSASMASGMPGGASAVRKTAVSETGEAPLALSACTERLWSVPGWRFV